MLRYDPERIDALRRRTVDAAADLAAISSTDPAAVGAMDTVRRVHSRLEHDWLPLLARLARSDAMLTWSTGGPAAIDIDDLAVVLARVAGDAAAADALFAELGGAGTAAVLLELGGRTDDHDDALTLATLVRHELIEASHRGNLPASFADDLVASLVADVDRPGANAGVALSFLLGAQRPSTDVLVDVVRSLVDHELESAGDDPAFGGSLWAPCSGLSAVPSVLIDPTDREAGDSPDLRPGGDPMMAALDALADDPDAGRRVFADGGTARYLFHERDYWMDGMRRLAEAAAAAAPGSPLVASAFVNHVGARDRAEVLGLYDIAPVRDAAATILGHHVASVQHAVLLPERLDDPVAGVVQVADELHGDGATVTTALFDEASLGLVTALAVGSTTGTATMRAAVGLHQRSQAADGVGRLARGEIDDPDRFLVEALSDAARLEAHVVAHVGHRAEAMGRSRDDAITFWTDVASDAIDSFDPPGIDIVLEPVAEAMTERFAVHEAAAVRTATEDADAAAEQLLYVWYRELYRQGVVVPVLPAAAVSGGQLVPWERFRQLGPGTRLQVRSLMEETTGGVNIDGRALRDAIKVEQLPIYDELR